MVERLRAVADRCAELERQGYQATVRLTGHGFVVSVSRNFHTARHTVTFEEVCSLGENIMLRCLDRCAERCPRASFETA